MYRFYTVLPVVLALIEKDGRVLLGKRARRPYYNKWDLPGGRVNPHEFLEDAIKREVREETTLQVSKIRLDGGYHYPGNEGSPAIFLLYQVQLFYGQEEQTKELPELNWFSRKDLINLDLTPWSSYFLKGNVKEHIESH
jgi:8-oxo-dGTP pyrophosphatase MutT (NUDIX family)